MEMMIKKEGRCGCYPEKPSTGFSIAMDSNRSPLAM